MVATHDAAVRLVSRHGKPTTIELNSEQAARRVQRRPAPHHDIKGGTSHGSRSKRRRTSRPAADLVVSLPDFLAGRRRHVLRRLRSLYRRRRAGLRGPDQVLDRSAKPAIHLADLRRHDAGCADHRICRRQDGAAVHLSDQSLDFRAGVAGGGLRAGHEPADRLPLRAGPRPRRRNRRRLFDADRIRSAEDARALAVDDGVHRGGRISGDRPARLSHHPGVRLAADVRHRRHRLARSSGTCARTFRNRRAGSNRRAAPRRPKR